MTNENRHKPTSANGNSHILVFTHIQRAYSFAAIMRHEGACALAHMFVCLPCSVQWFKSKPSLTAILFTINNTSRCMMGDEVSNCCLLYNN